MKNQRSKNKIMKKTKNDDIMNAPPQVLTKRPDSKRKATSHKNITKQEIMKVEMEPIVEEEASQKTVSKDEEMLFGVN